MPAVKIGRKAPAFAVPDQHGKVRTLAEFAGKWVLLYFYPKDDTPGCTMEACAFRDSFASFSKLKAVVLGVSADSAKKHVSFIKKYGLPFILLADEKKTLIRAYGAWGQKKFMGREYMGIYRHSFLIDPDGNVAKIYEKVKPLEHADEVLRDLQTLGA